MKRLGLSLAAAALCALLFTTVTGAQNTASVPHVFWGDLLELDSVVRAINEDGEVVAERSDFWQQQWSLMVFPEEASRVAFELRSSRATGRVEWFGVQAGALTQIRVYEFTLAAPEPPTELDVENPASHVIEGSGFSGEIVRAFRNPFAMGSGRGGLVGLARTVNGSWTIVISRAGDLIRRAIFETRIGARLYQTPMLELWAGGRTTLSPGDFNPAPEAHAFWGRGFASMRILLVTDERVGYANVGAFNGEWSAVHLHDPENLIPINFIVLETGQGSSLRRTGALPYVPGSVTQVQPSDFTSRDWPAPTQSRGGSMMDEADASHPSAVEIEIIARLRPSGRIEFGVRVAGSREELFPARRFLPADPPTGRWLRSTPVSVDEIPVGSIIARRLSSERTEFGFRPDWDVHDDLFPQHRFFPSDAEVDRWLRSSVISVRIAP